MTGFSIIINFDTKDYNDLISFHNFIIFIYVFFFIIDTCLWGCPLYLVFIFFNSSIKKKKEILIFIIIKSNLLFMSKSQRTIQFQQLLHNPWLYIFIKVITVQTFIRRMEWSLLCGDICFRVRSDFIKIYTAIIPSIEEIS